MRRALGVASGMASLLVALALAACGSDTRSPFFGNDAGGGADRDGGPEGRGEGGLPLPPDASSAIDAGATPADREGLADATACFDGLDNDHFAASDCEDPACSTLSICCVGQSSEACCGAPAPAAAWPDPAGPCADGPIEACASALAIGTPFGAPLPWIDEGGIVPNGEPTSDSGLVLDRTVTPRASIVRIRAEVAAPMGCAGCVDGVAIGLARQALGDANVTPIVALQVSGSRGEVMVVAGNSVLFRQPLPDASAHRYLLTTYPDGRVELDLPETTPSPDWRSTILLPEGSVEVVLYGRTTNRGPTDPAARVTALELATSGCDVPTSLLRGAPALFAPTSAPFGAGRAHAPSVAVHDGGTGSRMAFAAGGSIWLAQPDGGGGFGVPALANPALLRNEAFPWGWEDPSLVALDDRWLLFVTTDDAGPRRIQMIEGDPGFGESFDPAMLRDVLPAMPEGVVAMDGASAFRDGGMIYLVARAVRAGGESEIVLLRGPTDGAEGPAAFDVAGVCGTGCADVASEAGAITLHAPRHDVIDAYDRDEVAAPSLVRTSDGVYRLYFAGRRGTRWSIGMLVSMDLRFFRDPIGRAVLSASGEGDDALGVTDPEPWLLPDRIVLFHTGTDGAQTHVLAATQPLE